MFTINGGCKQHFCNLKKRILPPVQVVDVHCTLYTRYSVIIDFASREKMRKVAIMFSKYKL
jgi:hypothetical protein